MSKRTIEENPQQEKKFKETPDSSHIVNPSKSPARTMQRNRARYYTRSGDDDKGHKKLSGWEGSEPPTEEGEIRNLQVENDFQNGDIVNFGDFRDLRTYFVKVDPDVSFVRNEDHSGSGYLSVPNEILKNVDNFREKYEDIIVNSKKSINFRPKGSDGFLREYLGALPEEGWDYDVTFTGGFLESFSVRHKRDDEELMPFMSFRLDDTTWEDILEFFEARSRSLSHFKVKVDLEGKDFDRYKAKHDLAGKLNGWMTVVPDLPVGWRCDRGGSSVGSRKYIWTWNISGPTETESEMRENIDILLESFPHEYIV